MLDDGDDDEESPSKKRGSKTSKFRRSESESGDEMSLALKIIKREKSLFDVEEEEVGSDVEAV